MSITIQDQTPGPYETEIVHCKTCSHDFEAFANDLGTYMCPECFEDIKTKDIPKALDRFFKNNPPEAIKLRKRA